jgi:hypothetical protein
MKCMAKMPTPITRPPTSGASVKWRLPISKPTRQASTAVISTAPVASGSKPLESNGSSARIEMKVEAHKAAPVPTEAMNSQPWRVAPSVERARAKWRMPTQVPNRQTQPASRTSIC